MSILIRNGILFAMALAGLLVGASLAGAQSPGLEAVVTLVTEGRLAQAEGELRRVLAVGDSAQARDLLGFVLVRQGRAGEAEAQFRRAVELDGSFAPARQNLGRLLLESRREEEALEHLRVALRSGPMERELALQLARLEVAGGNAEVGEELYEKMGKEFGSVRAMVELGRSLARRGESQEAISVLYQAKELAPNSEQVLSAYCRLCVEHNAPVAAMKTVRELIRMHPEVAEYWYLLGLTRMQLSESHGVEPALRKSLEIAPQRVLPMFALGLSFRDQKRYAEAKEMLFASLQLMPSHADSLVVLAEVEEGLGEIELAEQHLMRAINLGGENPSALYVLGKIRMTQRRYEEAREALVKAIDMDPRPRKAHYQLSLAYARLGEREKSQESLVVYRKATKDAEDLLVKMRTDAGLGNSGMGRLTR